MTVTVPPGRSIRRALTSASSGLSRCSSTKHSSTWSKVPAASGPSSCGRSNRSSCSSRTSAPTGPASRNLVRATSRDAALRSTPVTIRPGVAREQLQGLRLHAAAQLEHGAACRQHRVVVQQDRQRLGLVAQASALSCLVAVHVVVEQHHLADHLRQGRHVVGRVDTGSAGLQGPRQPVAQRCAEGQVGVERPQVTAQDALRGRVVTVEQLGDAGQPRTGPAQGDGPDDADEIALVVATVPGGGAVRPDEPDRLPVPQHPHRQAGGRSDLPDGESCGGGHAGDARS